MLDFIQEKEKTSHFKDNSSCLHFYLNYKDADSLLFALADRKQDFPNSKQKLLYIGPIFLGSEKFEIGTK